MKTYTSFDRVATALDHKEPDTDIEPQWYEQTVDVGSFALNDFDLYDTHGNISEWCQDFIGDDYY